MKRDMELIRKILLLAECTEGQPDTASLLEEGYSETAIGFHYYLLGDAGLAVTISVQSHGDPLPKHTLINISWAGYEFLDTCRDPTTWEKAKETLNDAGADLGNVTLDTLKALLIKIAATTLGL